MLVAFHRGNITHNLFEFPASFRTRSGRAARTPSLRNAVDVFSSASVRLLWVDGHDARPHRSRNVLCTPEDLTGCDLSSLGLN